MLRFFKRLSKHKFIILGLLFILVAPVLILFIASKQASDFRSRAESLTLGQAVKLSGQSTNPEYITVTHNEGLKPYQNFTVEAWIKPLVVDPQLDQTVTSTIITKKVSDQTQTQPYIDDYGLQLKYSYQTNGLLNVYYTFSAYSGKTLTDCIPLSVGANLYQSLEDINKWIHIAGVIDNGFMSIYVNGKRLHTGFEYKFEGNLCAKTNPILIGAGPGNYFKGEIDEVRISSTARYFDDFIPSTAAFISDMNTTAIWHFDGDATDRNGLGYYPGTVIGSVEYTQGIVEVTDPSLTITPTPVTFRSRVFVTSTSYSGNLGGLSGADVKCQERANTEQLGGKWKAWLSDNNISVNERLYHSPSPYKLLNYTVIADNWEDLVTNFDSFTNPLASPINVYENRKLRQPNDGTTSVWTNTKTDADSAGLSCNNWTDGSIGIAGSVAAINSNWTNSSSDSCANQYRLYCFEQPDAPTPTYVPTPTPILQTQTINLLSGWNWVSLNVEPQNADINVILAPIIDKVEKVLSEQSVFSTLIDPIFNTLKKLETGKLYMVYVNNPTVLNINGNSKPVNTPIDLHRGWNWVGYYPKSALPIEEALTSIKGKYQIVVDNRGFYKPNYSESTINNLLADHGYLIYLNEPSTLIYPEVLTLVNPLTSSDCLETKTTQFTHLILNELSTPQLPKDNLEYQVQAVNSQGNLCGCVNYQLGKPTVIRLYGSEKVNTYTLTGFDLNETIKLNVINLTEKRVVNQVVTNYQFNPDWVAHEITVPQLIPKNQVIPTKVIKPTLFKNKCPQGQIKPHYRITNNVCKMINRCGISNCNPKIR